MHAVNELQFVPMPTTMPLSQAVPTSEHSIQYAARSIQYAAHNHFMLSDSNTAYLHACDARYTYYIRTLQAGTIAVQDKHRVELNGHAIYTYYTVVLSLRIVMCELMSCDLSPFIVYHASATMPCRSGP